MSLLKTPPRLSFNPRMVDIILTRVPRLPKCHSLLSSSPGFSDLIVAVSIHRIVLHDLFVILIPSDILWYTTVCMRSFARQCQNVPIDVDTCMYPLSQQGYSIIARMIRALVRRGKENSSYIKSLYFLVC
jgi:hypothetical protein